MLAGLLPLCASAGVSSQPFNKRFYISDPDTIAKQDTAKMDLEDLENMLPDSVLETKQDTVMGIPRPKGYNGLRFVLDKRHRYAGDQFVDSGFFSHTYVMLGGGASAFLPNGRFSYTPIANLHIGVAKELSPMSTIRLYAEKSWGSFRVIDVDNESMTIKVVLNPGHKMNYHSHERRDEIWVVIEGSGRTVVDGMEQQVKAGDVITMQAGCRHTVIAGSKLKLIEVQLGKDIDVRDKKKYRLEDEGIN